mmetsp:Transcript_14786/g.24494  ORF Transcript_14786/g.24494 Transcript_14786/m.24494 type:complete len:764 (+) Transcript_14786:92-2383(+)
MQTLTNMLTYLGDARRLEEEASSSPAWMDFLIIFAMCCILFLFLYLLLKMSIKFQNTMKERVRVAKEKRRNTRDNFRTENGYSWDCALVFKVYLNSEDVSEAQSKYSIKRVLHELADGGLETRLFYSAQADEVYCKVRAPLDRLQQEADRVDMKLALDPEAIRTLSRAGKVDSNGKQLWPPINIPDECDETPYSPFDYIYGKYEYEREDVAKLYKVYSNNTVFRGVDRLKLIFNILKAKKYEGGCHLDVYRLLQDQCMVGFFPLHDHVELQELELKWLQFFQWPWNQPVNEIKDYFGEKIGLYFLWLGHYTIWLFVAGFVGLCAWINIAVNGNDPNAEVMPYFSVFMALWATLFLEFWKRKQSFHAMKWGMVGFEEEEQARPQFKGELRPSPVDGKQYLYFDRKEEQKRVTQSSIIIFGFIMVVVAVVASIFVLKLVLSQKKAFIINGLETASIIAALANAIQIQIMNVIYGGVAIQLTDYENHRTDTEYEDSLISKTFVFQFVNSYASLFYIAFFKPFLAEDPCIGSCMHELQANLGTIFLTRLAIGNLTEVGIPSVQSYLKTKEGTKGVEGEVSEVEKTFFMHEYHVMLGTFDDYAEMIIQFGYATMFVAAFPLAAAMSFVNNYIEIRVDGWKLCQICRRPEPRSAEDIGTWYHILEIMAFFAVLSNSAIVAFTGNYTLNYTWVVRVWIFVCMAAGIMGVKMLIAAIVPDEPHEVTIQLQRAEYLNDKFFNDIVDEDDMELTQTVASNVEYCVRETDDDPL